MTLYGSTRLYPRMILTISKESHEIHLVAYDRVLAQDSDNIPQLAMTKITQAMNTASLETIGQAQTYGNSFGLDLMKVHLSNQARIEELLQSWTSAREDARKASARSEERLARTEERLAHTEERLATTVQDLKVIKHTGLVRFSI